MNKDIAKGNKDDLIILHLYSQIDAYDMSLVVRKPALCICENKDADQLLWLHSPVWSDQVRNPEDWFSHNEV